MRKVLGPVLAAVLLAGTVSLQDPVSASSHREAPLISEDPVADNTDVYLFKDQNDPTKVNIIANFVPQQVPAGGPNFYKFGDEVRYELHINNNGENLNDDITYEFRFRTVIGNPETFLYNTGPVTSVNDPDANMRQFYDVRRTDRNGTTVVATDVPSPPSNVGVRSTPNYDSALAVPAIRNLPGGGKVFAGQREDPFFADTGSIFDLLGLRPLNGAHAIPRATAPGVDGLGGLNVQTIALQVPISSVTKNGNVPTVLDSKDSTIGVYASTSRRESRVLRTFGGVDINGKWVQISRLAIPLVNEVLIPLGQKDQWNLLAPKDDAQFFKYILDPEPTKLADALYPALQTPPPGGFNADGSPKRTDIVAVLRGAALGLSPANLLPPADLLRVNLATPVTPASQFSRFGFLGAAGDGSNGNADGFPNGRRLGDDVVDIELRLLTGGTALSPTPSSNAAPNNALTDGVNANDSTNKSSFPYVASPYSGYRQTPPGRNAQ